MEFSRQEYWNGLHFLLQEILLTQGMNLCLICLLNWQESSLPLTQRLPLKKSSLPTFHIQFQSEIFRNSVNLWCFHYIIYHSLPDSILFYFMPINLNFFLVWKEQADRAITMIHWTKALRAIVNLKGRKTRGSTKTNRNTYTCFHLSH